MGVDEEAPRPVGASVTKAGYQCPECVKNRDFRMGTSSSQVTRRFDF